MVMKMNKVINSISRQDVEQFRMNATDPEMRFVDSMDFYSEIATKSAIYPGQGTPLGLAYVALKLNGEAGEFAEHVGKAMRDDQLVTLEPHSVHSPEGPWFTGDYVAKFQALPDERRALLIKELGDQLWYISAACNELGVSLSEVAAGNLEKLCDRSERNALRGSGDER